jgi:hypothetical protein
MEDLTWLQSHSDGVDWIKKLSDLGEESGIEERQRLGVDIEMAEILGLSSLFPAIVNEELLGESSQ